MPAFARPGDVSHVATIRRPRRHELTNRRISQATRRARWQVHNPELVQRTERDSLSIGRERRPANQSRSNGRTIVNAVLEVDAGRDLGLYPGGERNHRRFASLHVDTLDLSINRDYEGIA